MLTSHEKKGKKTGRAEKHACMKAEFKIKKQKRASRAQEKSDAENDPEAKAFIRVEGDSQSSRMRKVLHCRRFEIPWA